MPANLDRSKATFEQQPNSNSQGTDDLSKQLLLERVEDCFQQAESVLNCSLPRPEVLLNQRGKVAGSALLQLNTLRFHPTLFAQNHDHFLSHVVAHEVAHLIVWQRYGKVSPHGKEWQQIMTTVFKLPANRTHSYNTANLGIRTFSYQCRCGAIDLSIRRHNKIIKGTRYCCKRCHSELIAV